MSAAISTTDSLRWVEQGTRMLSDALDALGHDESTWDADSALPGWTRKHLIAHVAANADALNNLVHWARTGEKTPMYSSPEQRAADIETGSQLSGAELRGWFRDSAKRLMDGLSDLSTEQWQAEVRTAQGRTLPATQIPWLRAREVLIHPVDLGTDMSFTDLPEDFLHQLITDIAARRADNGPALRVIPAGSNQPVAIPGSGPTTTVTGPLPEIAAWLAGRAASDLQADDTLPTLPPWL